MMNSDEGAFRAGAQSVIDDVTHRHVTNPWLRERVFGHRIDRSSVRPLDNLAALLRLDGIR
ncbi:hypothetical protein [Filomicrobium sp.]|uniref:hypothetical protein n=1 Tax=Filomicrobium sp. TaxID=2024831 RepID=UPI00258EF3B9|nr:hypothetical protein [Filomicrobium sp.]MCV0369528.1 hypothetical protein [Filomicrobium sp.]